MTSSTHAYKGGFIHCDSGGATRAQVGDLHKRCTSVAGAERVIRRIMKAPGNEGATLGPFTMPRDYYHALRDFAAEHGTDWRRELNRQWQHGGTAGPLQSMRNDPGWHWALYASFAFDND